MPAIDGCAFSFCVPYNRSVGPAAKGLVTVVEGAYAAGKLIAADCHGPMGLIDCKKPDGTPLVAGLSVTSFTNSEEAAAGATAWVEANSVFMETKFTELGATFAAGADWSSHVVVDGKVITAQNPGSAIACAEACIKALAA